MRFAVIPGDDPETDTGEGLRLRGYLPGDELRLAPRSDFAQAFRDGGEVLPAGRLYTFADGATVLGVGGLSAPHLEEDEGCWQAWAYMADLTPRQWLVAAEFARIVLAAFAGAALIYAIPADTGGARRLLQRIGFVARGEHWIWEA